ncbi:uncharacterized protein CcaverHIS019_0503180 [Cutaneotrichosporon cavernicola]|uniref:ClpS-like protein n=1 Tax=Cutaneotrichosporon cavernicola TaxID=279322 RepID=A0AA48L690_9TREE|nr:uncharacterized protein CcaverHIS019_0503180 [Cutaneotrichosporon cavernicola]BEI92690.1 hypothetical protein CcaverHIS019_0503180 [Cutaneotrichosporon cavernicola]BEJ00465.1 hypothetical protein CcaverHIS631_0503220 [Cutaneotrichosporon cavernicola]BEJ08234.1 hypothetical protein CcaverHIS641_0503190 [Cutaneotrichosporon cavernicola]
MSAPRTVLRALRASSSRATYRAPARAFSSTRIAREEAAPAVSPKIASIVDSVEGLTLLEVSELVSALKTRLNITEVALPAAGAAPAAAAAVDAGEAPAAEEKPKEKTIFTVKLEKIDASAKAKIIREVKGLMPNMNLVEAKKFVESVPQTLKENVPKEEAEKLMKTLQDLGATVSMS